MSPAEALEPGKLDYCGIKTCKNQASHWYTSNSTAFKGPWLISRCDKHQVTISSSRRLWTELTKEEIEVAALINI